jgi:uncharacterized membrane protein YfcA
VHYFIFSLIGVITGLFMAVFGIGGGAFIVPALDAAFLIVPHFNRPPFQLIVIGSLCTIVIGALPRAIKVLRGSKSERNTANILILSALVFILPASILATEQSDTVLRLGFSITIALVGLWTILGKSSASKTLQHSIKPNLIKLITVGAISGVSSVLFGLGGATLLMPLLTMWVSLPIAACVNISILFVLAISIVSLTTLSFAWIGIHGTDSIDSAIIILILILGISAAVTQTIAAGKLLKMKDCLRQKLLGCYLITLGIWVIIRLMK